MAILLVARWFSVSVPFTAVSDLKKTVIMFYVLSSQFSGGEGSFLKEDITS